MGNQAINQILDNIYRRLFSRYGPQHWWPAREPFEVIVGAILTQSAAWTNVEKAISNLRAAGALSPEALRRMPQSELARLIYPSGYYNAKARKLKAFAHWFGEQHRDSLEDMFTSDINSLRERLLAIYGIGEETADSIMLYAGNKPVFVIDAYTRRIIGRIRLVSPGKDYAACQSLFMGHLPADAGLFNEYHALLVRLAKSVCQKRPCCEQCCLNATGEMSQDDSSKLFPCSALTLPDQSK